MRHTTSLSFEPLEPRLAMAGVNAVLSNGLLTVTATSGDDYVSIDRRGNKIYVAEADASFKASKVNFIAVYLGDGNDTLSIKSSARSLKSFGEWTAVSAGNGDDTFVRPDGKKLYFGGTDDLLSFSKTGGVRIDGAEPDWFSKHLSDSSLRSVARAAAVDSVFSRDDMLDIFADVTPAAVIGSAAFNSLQELVGNSRFYAGLQNIGELSSYIVNGCVANEQYQGNPLGNLQASSTGAQLQLLVNKWFLGLDHPSTTGTGYSGTLTYKHAAGNLFDGTPHYTQMDQGEDGDCYFLSSLTSTIVQDPQRIVDMFIVNGDGTWTVRFFYKTSPYYVTIDDMLPVDNHDEFVFANDEERFDNPHNILWPALAEKAFAQFAEFGYVDSEGPKTNSYAALNEGNPAAALSNILGAKESPMQELSAKSFKDILKAFDNGRPVVFTTKEHPPSPHIVSDHVYALVTYNAATQKFELFNPWGIIHNNTNKPGYNYLTLHELLDNFGYWGYGPVL